MVVAARAEVGAVATDEAVILASDGGEVEGLINGDGGGVDGRQQWGRWRQMKQSCLQAMVMKSEESSMGPCGRPPERCKPSSDE